VQIDCDKTLPRILVVEDEEKMARLLNQVLTESGFEVTVARDGYEGKRLAAGHDLAIVDVMMPIVDGFTMVQHLRKEGNWIPILFLTARDMPEDLVAGLALGGDDYVTKPFRLAELVARLRALLRRASAGSSLLIFEDLVLDQANNTVRRGPRSLFLSSTEFRLLQIFMRRAGEVVSKEEVLREIWNDESTQRDENVVEVYVHYLRTKLEAFDQPRILNTIKGQGYVLEAPTQPH
jgi:DNA-binding response OmpR family regulator